MRRAFDLLQLLADGAEHSGAELAGHLGVTRAAIWNQVKRLRDEGVAIDATPGHGYVLPAGFEPLSAAQIQSGLAAANCVAYRAVTVVPVTDSTNEQLLKAHQARDVHAEVMFAEYQSAGRGRRGDRWMSPPGSGLCFSLGWRFDAPPASFSALSLVIGVALVRSLHRLGLTDAALKWPNDIVRGARKMAGILIEMRAEASGPCVTVIGIGLNINLSDHARTLIDRPADDVTTAAGREVSRNEIAAELLAGLAAALTEFSVAGFPPFRPVWLQHDALAGREVTLDLGSRQVSGIARGVDAQGALLIETNGRAERFLSGHLTAH